MLHIEHNRYLSKQIPLKIRKSLNNLYNIFNGHELYLVGGCVRDLLLNKEPKDYDLSTNLKPEEVKNILQGTTFKTWDSGIKHGTLTIVEDITKNSFEITTYRIDGKYKDNRHPESVDFTSSLEEDLKRRDFTINSFAYDYNKNDLLMLDKSYLYDLDLGVIKCIGDPLQRFMEDSLRMLRAIRFSAQLGFNIHKDTFNIIKQNANLLSNISKERIRDELTKILLSDNPHKIILTKLTDMDRYCGFAGFTLGLLENCSQNNKYHYTDVLHHTLDVVQNVRSDFELRWAAFLHDFGKLSCKVLGQDGYEHFYGHAEHSYSIVERVADELKFTTKQKENIGKLVRYHDAELLKVGPKGFKKLINNVGIELFPKYLELRQADALAHSLCKDESLYIDAVSRAKDMFVKIVLEGQPLKVSDLKINGKDLMKLGYSGKEIGEQLNVLLDKVLENPELNKKRTLLNLSKK